MDRVQPGSLEFKKPRDFVGIYEKLETMVEWVLEPTVQSPFIWMPLLLSWCTYYNVTNEEGLINMQCYDNVFADISLNGGHEPGGIFGYIDVFSWGGYFAMFWFAVIKETLDNLIWNWVIGTMFGFAYYKMMDVLPLCVDTDEALHIAAFGMEIELCNYFKL